MKDIYFNSDLSRKAMDLEKPDYTFNAVFSLSTWKAPHHIGYLFDLSDFDNDLYWNSLKALKAGQRIFRYETAIMFGHMRPLIMIDFSLKQPRLYFCTEDAKLKDYCDFEKKGYTFNWADFEFSMPN